MPNSKLLPVVYPPFLTRVKNALKGAVTFPVKTACAIPFALFAAVVFWHDRDSPRDGLLFGFAATCAVIGFVYFGGAALFGLPGLAVAIAALSAIGAYFGFRKPDRKATDHARDEIRLAAKRQDLTPTT